MEPAGQRKRELKISVSRCSLVIRNSPSMGFVPVAKLTRLFKANILQLINLCLLYYLVISVQELYNHEDGTPEKTTEATVANESSTRYKSNSEYIEKLRPQIEKYVQRAKTSTTKRPAVLVSCLPNVAALSLISPLPFVAAVPITYCFNVSFSSMSHYSHT